MKSFILKSLLFCVVSSNISVSESTQPHFFWCDREYIDTQLDAQVIRDIYKIKRPYEDIYRDWRKDSLGCLGLRSGMEISRTFHVLQYKSKAEIIALLGKPNRYWGNPFAERNIYLIYYFGDTFCTLACKCDCGCKLKWKYFFRIYEPAYISIHIQKEKDYPNVILYSANSPLGAS